MILFKINYPLNLQSVYESIYLFSFLFYYFLLLLSSCWGLVRGLILIPSAVYPHTHTISSFTVLFSHYGWLLCWWLCAVEGEARGKEKKSPAEGRTSAKGNSFAILYV